MLKVVLFTVASAVVASVAAAQTSTPWRGVQLGVSSDADLQQLEQNLPALVKSGVNKLVLEVDYNYQFKSRPEMADPNGISFQGARKFAGMCRQSGVDVIPEIDCLGHQSWAQTTMTLLKVHPELDETPGMYPDNKGIYCRSYCPLNPELPKVLFPLIDELDNAFQAKMFHVGMDEVFILGADTCPRCHGKSKAWLFAKAVNDLHRHLAKKHIQMLMWADRFLDAKTTGYGRWEASDIGTSPAIDMVPKDIIMCDWHYDLRPNYPSIQILTSHGFRVWPSTWHNAEAASAFSLQGKVEGKGLVIGALCTVWGRATIAQLATWPALIAAFQPWMDNAGMVVGLGEQANSTKPRSHGR